MSDPVSLTVVGSVNLDIVASGAILPSPGETVTGATLQRHPGGKGANMALAAQRLGADVSLVARVGEDAFADEALALLWKSGAKLIDVQTVPHLPTGVALIAVSEAGENQIIVASGANDALLPEHMPAINTDAVLCVLEVPINAVMHAARTAAGFVAVNLAPALPVPDELFMLADLIVVNEGEAAFYGDQLKQAKGLVAITLGSAGAQLCSGKDVLAEAAPPAVDVVDTTGAGDTFSAALTIAMCSGKDPKDALNFAVTASALAVTKAGAQPSLPALKDVTDYLA